MGQGQSASATERIPQCEICTSDIIFPKPTDNTASSSSSAAAPNSLTATMNNANHNSNYALSCRMNHHLCAECATNYIQVTFMNKTFDIGVVPELECPAHSCGIVFREHQIARIVNEETFQQYLDKKLTARDGMILANMRNQLSSMSPEELQDQAEIDRRVLAKQLRSQLGATNTAYQCPKCAFGPIEINGCWDLLSHNNQASGGGGSRISNSCPQCKYFTADRNNWHKWDGEVKNIHAMKKKMAESESLSQRSILVGSICAFLFVLYRNPWVAVFAFIIGVLVRNLALAIEERHAAKLAAETKKRN